MFLVFPALASEAGNYQKLGFPFVQNYSKHTYQAANQNWSVTQDNNGVMYWGNSEGLLVYDGHYWQLHKMPHNIIVRAVAADSGGKVYAGGFGEFGYWKYNQQGTFSYKSLVSLIPEGYELKDEIWKIYVDRGRVIFQSFSAIYIYEQGKVRVIKGANPFLFLFRAGDRFFVQVISEGLFELKNDSLIHIAGSEAFEGTGVLSVLPYKKNLYLIGTAKKGMFVFDGTHIEPWENQANDFLKENQLNNGIFIQDSRHYAYGTILNGIVILDENGNVVQHTNKSKGLQNNTVLSLFADKDQNLWAGLDNGIDRVEVNSPLYFFFDKAGKFGTVYSSIIHNNKIYLGTNQGLFYSGWSPGTNQSFQSFDFKLIDNSQGQVWDLSLIDGQLLCGHNEGTFRVEGNTIVRISDVKGGWTIKKLNSNPAYLIQGTYTGLVLYKKDAKGNWTFSHRLENFSEPSRYVEQDNTGHIWVSHAYKGLYKLNPARDLRSIKSSQNFDKADGLPNSYNVNTFRLDNQIVFSSNSGFYVYDDVSNKFTNYKQLNDKLGSFASSNRIIKAADKKYWFIDNGKVALADFTEPGAVKINSSPFSVLSGRMVQYYENISRISNNIYLISIDEGFVVYNAEAQQNERKALPTVLIRKIENITDGLTSITENGSKLNSIELPYAKNNIRFSYALPYYTQENVNYQYFLDGYSQSWSGWTSDTQKEFTNLAQGEYQFKVRAKISGKAESPVTVFTFTVLPPWYASTWALTAYGIVAIVAMALARYLYKLRLQRDQQRIQQKLEREKEEHLKREAIATEQKIVKLRNEQLRNDLAAKSRELASSALNIIAKNELLQNLSHEILQLKDSNGKKLAAAQLKRLQKVIDEGMSNDYDWNLFENSFNEAHENYFKKLKTSHSELTPNDLKLCAYLRMNMSSKEIASLLNITVRGVEIRRYRLRKKLNLEHEKNLTEFLMEV
ncbi:triple tyrosine motif-containing protein [Pontibacter silvestris]|uniref:Triple tyrosine motif-containing protein n=1 Tax=Pontibacter silvestris TaxID=2305183 RepID=A0ABW4X4D5_9BACT|nr:triple tyrosine motif-containing protein [Pontibacter silvestris]MCC9137890.1 hypothetical protein [Pontibacter silvestris]